KGLRYGITAFDPRYTRYPRKPSAAAPHPTRIRPSGVMPVIFPVLTQVAKASDTPLACSKSFRYAGRPPIHTISCESTAPPMSVFPPITRPSSLVALASTLTTGPTPGPGTVILLGAGRHVVPFFAVLTQALWSTLPREGRQSRPTTIEPSMFVPDARPT